jgi:hypothetical protein
MDKFLDDGFVWDEKKTKGIRKTEEKISIRFK